MIEKDICPTCEGMGHQPNCQCRGAVDFVVGCCKECGGEGFITRPKIKTAPCICEGKGCDLCGGSGELPILPDEILERFK